MPSIADLLRKEATDIREQITGAGDDRAAILVGVNRLAALHNAITETRHLLADTAPELLKHALSAGVDRAELVGKPYGETVIRKLARDAGLPRIPPGPPPRRRKRTAA